MTSKNKRKRSYDESFLKLGYTEFNGKPKCVICLKILLEESIKKNKLQRHLTTNHPGCVDKSVELFERKMQSVASQKNVLTAFIEVNKSAVYSLYATCYQIAKQKKSPSIGKKLLMPVMKDVVERVIGERESEISDSVQISGLTLT